MGPTKKQWATIALRLDRWSKALKREVELHGRPNSFGVTELAGEYGLTRRDGYYLGKFRLFDLWQRLGGHDGWGSAPTYSNGRFYL
jgi:hypothetical protein